MPTLYTNLLVNMQVCRILFTLLSTLSVVFLSAQSISQKFNYFIDSYPIDKVYVNHDKPYYATGETIWCKVLLVEGSTHQAFEAEPIVYVDWIDPFGKIQQNFALKIKEGDGLLDIQTSAADSTGLYTLRAYTQYQRNFDDHFIFQKQIRVLDKIELDSISPHEHHNFSINFYPEGGYLVAGLPTTIAFKAQDSLGNNLNINGSLFNSDHQELTKLTTAHQGMGQFRLTPKPNQTYYIRAYCKGVEKKFILPTILPQGYRLSANSSFTDQIKLTIESNTPDSLANCVLIGHVRGQLFMDTPLPSSKIYNFSINKASLPSGILHFTLFDAQQRPVAERLIFNKNPKDNIILELETDKDIYSKRDKVLLELSPKLEEVTIPAKLTVSVYQNDLLDAGPNNLNIVNYLWLQSDLKGRIDNIQEYFEEDTPKTRSLLDLLLLTHGWRRFKWQDILNNRLPELLYLPEEHLSIAGKITKLDKDQPIKSDVMVNILSDELFASLNMTTEEDGLFYFTGFDFTDTTDVLIQANIHNPKKQKKLKAGEVKPVGDRNLDIELLDLNEYAFNDTVSIPSKIYKANRLKEYAYNVERNQITDSLNNPFWSIDLDEVTVRSRLSPGQIRENKIQKTYKSRDLKYFNSTQKFLPDDPQYDGFPKKTVYDLIKVVVPKARYVIENGVPKIIYGSLSDRSEATIILDGQITPPVFLQSVDPDKIAIIEVLQGFYAKLYDDVGLVILLVSKDPSNVQISNPGIVNLAHPGYYQAREFYSPNYATPKDSHKAPDKRTTLYWNPTVEVDKDKAELSFYTADQIGSYMIWVEGITPAGIPFIKGKRFTVQE